MFCSACDIRVVTPETWDSFSNYNSIRAEAEIKASTALREAINYTVQQVWPIINCFHYIYI